MMRKAAGRRGRGACRVRLQPDPRVRRVQLQPDAARRHRPRKRFGQHFLEAAWVRKIVDLIDPRATDIFLEIGAGRGALTLPLGARARRLVSVEIDRVLAADLKSRAPENVEVVDRDFLEIDAESLQAKLTAGSAGARFRVAGNLPYNVSSPILFRLLAVQRESGLFTDASLMLQREVADRVVAGPGSSEYGVLSILVRLQAAASRLLTLPAGAFRPAPQVTSAVVRLMFRPGVPLEDPAVFEQLVRGLFTHRRKIVLNALKPFAAGRSPTAAEALARAGIDPSRRPETLEMAELARLADLFAAPAAAVGAGPQEHRGKLPREH